MHIEWITPAPYTTKTVRDGIEAKKAKENAKETPCIAPEDVERLGLQ